MRYRENGSLANRLVHHFSVSTNTYTGLEIITSPSTGYAPPQTYERMWDEVGNDRSFNDCRHERFYCEENNVDIVDVMTHGITVTNKTAFTVCAAMPENWVADLYNKIPLGPTEEEVNDFNSRAFQGMMPGIELKMDMPTFLTEVRSIPDLFKSGVLKKFLSSGKKAKNTGLETAVAGDFLNLQFGWLPTIADAQALYDTFTSVEKKLKVLIAKQGEVFTSHFSETIDMDGGDPIEWHFGNWGAYDSVVVESMPAKWKLTATMKYTYDLGELNQLSEKALLLRAYLEALGFNNPLRTLWERVPFSFMLDWVLPVGDWLEQFSGNWLKTNIQVIDYCISFKNVEPTGRKLFYKRTFPYSTLEGPVLMMTNWHNLYLRQKCLPNFDKFGLASKDRFGGKQALLSGALFASFFGKK